LSRGGGIIRGTVAAAILASGTLETGAGELQKATLTVQGETLLERVVRALREVGQVGEIMAVLPSELLEAPEARDLDARLERGPDVAANLRLADEWLKGRPHGLIVGVDLALLTSEALQEFLERVPDGVGIAYPIVRREDVQRVFPGAQWTYVKTRDGEITGGTLAYVKPEVLSKCLPLVIKAFDVRKNMAGLAAMLGARFVLKLTLGIARIAEIENRASEITGTDCRAIELSRPELVLDVDEPSHLEMAERLLANGQG